MTAPITYQWDGEAMVPLARLAKRCDEQFVIGIAYTLVEHQERSTPSHKQYFAAVREGWLNLPEHLAEDFPTEEHLRKWCLIRTGYSNSQSMPCSSKAEALRIAAFIRPMDEFSVVKAEGSVVSRYTAKSQSMKAMDKREFQASKEAVLNHIAKMLDVAPADLRHAEAA